MMIAVHVYARGTLVFPLGAGFSPTLWADLYSLGSLRECYTVADDGFGFAGTHLLYQPAKLPTWFEYDHSVRHLGARSTLTVHMYDQELALVARSRCSFDDAVLVRVPAKVLTAWARQVLVSPDVARKARGRGLVRWLPSGAIQLRAPGTRRPWGEVELTPEEASRVLRQVARLGERALVVRRHSSSRTAFAAAAHA